MDIGTAKISIEEMQGIPHYLIDVLEPTEEFNIVRFQQMAKAALEQIYAAGAIPIVVGGTGFYIQSLLYDIQFEESNEDTGYRDALQQLATDRGPEYLHRLLAEVDPAAASGIHAHNVKRVIRALEFYHQTGTRISEHNEEQRKRTSPYQFLYFVLNDDRQALYARIDQRIDQMLEAGLVTEVRMLKDMGCTRDMVSMQGLGYKEILDYLEGRCTLDDAIYILKRDTRHFAKRQLTWFRREPDVIWLNRTDYPDDTAILQDMLNRIALKNLTNA